MKYEMKRDGNALTVLPEGRLDTTAAPEFQAALQEQLEGTDALIIDLEKLDYISSAGLRVLIFAHKEMKKKHGSMKLVRVNGIIMEIFDVTGFTDILTIE